MQSILRATLLAASLMALSTTAFAAGELVFASNQSDEAPRAAFEALVEKFRAANPDINVEFNTIEHEAYKTAIRNFLVADEGPDIGMWFAGNRMAP